MYFSRQVIVKYSEFGNLSVKKIYRENMLSTCAKVESLTLYLDIEIDLDIYIGPYMRVGILWMNIYYESFSE